MVKEGTIDAAEVLCYICAKMVPAPDILVRAGYTWGGPAGRVPVGRCRACQVLSCTQCGDSVWPAEVVGIEPELDWDRSHRILGAIVRCFRGHIIVYHSFAPKLWEPYG
jgi:hypothetical protein